MKKLPLTLSLIFFGIVFSISAQSDVYSRLFYYSPGMFNPAATGLESKNFITTDFISRWYKLDFPPLRFNVGYERTIDKINSSVAAYYYYSQSGSLTNTNTLGISYSYKFKFAEDHFLKLGVQLNINRYCFDFSKLVFGDFIDPETGKIDEKPIGERSGTKPDINFGIWYSWKRLSIGASIVNVFTPDIIIIEEGRPGLKLPRFFTFVAKYEIQLSKSFELVPAIYYFSADNYQLSFDYLDYGLNLCYKKIINLGAVYASGRVSNWTVFAGTKIMKKINTQFSYGFPDKNLRNIGPVIEALVSYSIN
ncbi:MAG: PorP/SprF family type IX secretion system membrane protein [Bacteroidales bacterium]|nr:PorP/SprF family type IX secretion system membrane protein [Bacteroidales bacterium]